MSLSGRALWVVIGGKDVGQGKGLASKQFRSANFFKFVEDGDRVRMVLGQ